jgi:hypothetical protein
MRPDRIAQVVLGELFGNLKPIIAMLHLPPLGDESGSLELLVEELGDSPELLSGGQQLNALTLPTALLGAKEGRPHTLSHVFEDRLGFFPYRSP